MQIIAFGRMLKSNPIWERRKFCGTTGVKLIQNLIRGNVDKNLYAFEIVIF